MKKIIAGILSLALIGGSLPISSVLPNFTAFASEEEDYTTGYYYADNYAAEIEYKKYSDHIEISKCYGLSVENIDIPSTIQGLPVTSIGDYSFSGCTSLASVSIPDSVTYIGYSAFQECALLSSIIIPDSVENISHYAFALCYSLSSITIPDSVKTIGAHAFDGDRSLKSITAPKSVTKISFSAFDRCSSLESITILNPNCDMTGVFVGSLNITTTIYGYQNSTAHELAEIWNINFQAIDSIPAMGDLDGDGAVNALDASFVLMEYASIATGKSSTLTNEQKTAADVNKDSAIDALDASDILRYYSYTATGGTASMQDFMSK